MAESEHEMGYTHGRSGTPPYFVGLLRDIHRYVDGYRKGVADRADQQETNHDQATGQSKIDH